MTGAYLTTRIPLSKCPVCETPIDAATCVDEAKKPKGTGYEITVCLYCAAVLTFDGELKLRAMPEREINALPEDIFKKLSRLQGAAILRILMEANRKKNEQ